jgi:hypothetical protein
MAKKKANKKKDTAFASDDDDDGKYDLKIPNEVEEDDALASPSAPVAKGKAKKNKKAPAPASFDLLMDDDDAQADAASASEDDLTRFHNVRSGFSMMTNFEMRFMPRVSRRTLTLSIQCYSSIPSYK